MTTHRASTPQFTLLQLVLSVALGLWLGGTLLLLTGWLAWHFGAFGPLTTTPASIAPLSVAPSSPSPAAMPRTSPSPPPPGAPVAMPVPDADAMFQRYQQNLHEQQLRQTEEAARANPANQGNPGCQFWLQQAQTAPSENSREQVARLCN